MPLFYRAEMLLALLVGATLVALPAVIAEAPEPTFTAETMMRRVSGAQAGVLVATVNWVQLDAAKRGRLGASTFKLLNTGLCFSTVLVRCSSSAILALYAAFVLCWRGCIDTNRWQRWLAHPSAAVRCILRMQIVLHHAAAKDCVTCVTTAAEVCIRLRQCAKHVDRRRTIDWG